MATKTNPKPAASQQELDLAYQKVLVPVKNSRKALLANGASKGDRFSMPVAQLTFLPGFNVRIKNEDYHKRVRRFANSMKRDGFKSDKPLSVITVIEKGKTKTYGYAGYTRWDALALANKELAKEGKETIDMVPVVNAPAGTTLEDLTDDLVTGNEGTPLQPFEIGVVCKRKLNAGKTPEQIAEDLDFTVTYVNDLLFLMGSPKEIRDMVQAGQVAAGEAIKALHQHGDEAIQVLQRALDRATAAGKTRVTGRFIPGATYLRLIKQAAPVMVTTMKEVKADPGYAHLTNETKQKLAELLAAVEAAERTEAEQSGQAATPPSSQEEGGELAEAA